ncbi:MAG: O-methyltransferase [Armatimonadota bacterium]
MHISDSIAALLSDMEAEAKRVTESTRDKWLLPRSLHPDAAKLLNLLAKATGAKRMLEIGTSVGYSTVHLALAAQEIGGHLTTLELMPAKYEQAKANLARAGLADVVTQHLGDALKLLPTLPGPWDLVFLDPEKELYEDAWKSFSDKVRVGGVVVADNLVSHAEDLSGYVAMIQNDDRYETVTVPIGLGLEISYRRR